MLVIIEAQSLSICIGDARDRAVDYAWSAVEPQRMNLRGSL